MNKPKDQGSFEVIIGPTTPHRPASSFRPNSVPLGVLPTVRWTPLSNPNYHLPIVEPLWSYIVYMGWGGKPENLTNSLIQSTQRSFHHDKTTLRPFPTSAVTLFAGAGELTLVTSLPLACSGTVVESVVLGEGYQPTLIQFPQITLPSRCSPTRSWRYDWPFGTASHAFNGAVQPPAVWVLT